MSASGTADPHRPQVPELEFIAQITVQLARPIELGMTSAGLRRIIPILGGLVEGPVLHGEIIPGGADWNTWNDQTRSGSVFAQYAIRAQDEVVIGVTNTGRHTIPDNGEPIFTHPTLEAPMGAYEWLNHVALVGTLQPIGTEGTAVRLEFWRARPPRHIETTTRRALR